MFDSAAPPRVPAASAPPRTRAAAVLVRRRHVDLLLVCSSLCTG
ncbi:hypothetical protein [Streptomyces sp. NBC_01477]|nr:hypothetical protein [Streptomyces sp. NBC_01477]